MITFSYINVTNNVGYRGQTTDLSKETIMAKALKIPADEQEAG